MSCPECFSGAVHSGTPRGSITKVHGLDTYVVEPADGRPVKANVVIISDVFGLPFVNNKLLADHYADKGGFKVFLPDFMAGVPAPVWMIDTLRAFSTPGNYLSKPYHLFWGAVGIVPFLWAGNLNTKACQARITSFFTSVRAVSPLPLFGAGFCWGGKHICLLAHGDKTLVDAAFTGHPSMLDLPGDVEKIRVPVSFAIGDLDDQLPRDKVEVVKKVLEGKKEGERGEVRTYEGCGHGFCIRADVQVTALQVQVDKAEDQCVEWFQRHLGGS